MPAAASYVILSVLLLSSPAAVGPHRHHLGEAHSEVRTLFGAAAVNLEFSKDNLELSKDKEGSLA
jgi:hypothetical protein